MRLPVVGVVAAIAILSGAWAQAGSDVVTLDQCVQAALTGGDDNRILEANLQAARAQHAVDAARASVAVNGSLGYNLSENVDSEPSAANRAAGSLQAAAAGPQAGLTAVGPLTAVSATAYPYIPSTTSSSATVTPAAAAFGLSVTRTLWNGYPGGIARAGLEKSTLSLEGKELTASSGRSAIVYRVKQAYYTMLNAQRALSVRQENLARQNALLAQITATYGLEQASAVDLAGARINALSAAVDVRGAEHDLRSARTRLANLAGWPDDRAFAVAETDAAAIPSVTIEAAIAEGLSRRTEIRQIGLNKKSLDVDAALARGQATPTVSVNGGASWGLEWSGEPREAGGTAQPLSGGTVTAGVKVGMPLLDSGAAKRQREVFVREREAYAAQESQLRRSIAADIRDAHETMQILADRLEVARGTAENLDTLFQLTQTRVTFGTATNQDLLDASVNAANARAAAAKARSDLELAVLQLQSVMGY